MCSVVCVTNCKTGEKFIADLARGPSGVVCFSPGNPSTVTEVIDVISIYRTSPTSDEFYFNNGKIKAHFAKKVTDYIGV